MARCTARLLANPLLTKNKKDTKVNFALLQGVIHMFMTYFRLSFLHSIIILLHPISQSSLQVLSIICVTLIMSTCATLSLKPSQIKVYLIIHSDYMMIIFQVTD